MEYKLIFDEKRKQIDQSIPIGFELLPEKDPNDLFFDIEGYPMFIDTKTGFSWLEYLFGVHYRVFDNKYFKKFLSINHEEEKCSFEELINFFYMHIKKFPNASIYHFGSYEITALQNLSKKYVCVGQHFLCDNKNLSIQEGPVFIYSYKIGSSLF